MVTDYAHHRNKIQTLVKTATDCIVTCSVEDSCLLPLVIIPCRATGCCGISIFTAPTVRSPEFLSLVRLEMLEYRACDLPTVTFTTVLQKQSPQLREQNTNSTDNTLLSLSWAWNLSQHIPAYSILFNESAMPGEMIKRTLHAVVVSILSEIFNDIMWYSVRVEEVHEQMHEWMNEWINEWMN